MEEEKKERVELNKIEIRILDYLKKVNLASSTNISFNVSANLLYAKKYLHHLEELGYIEVDENYKQVLKHFTFWRLKKK